MQCLGSWLQTHGGYGGGNVRWSARGLQQRWQRLHEHLRWRRGWGAEHDNRRELQVSRLLLQVPGKALNKVSSLDVSRFRIFDITARQLPQVAHLLPQVSGVVLISYRVVRDIAESTYGHVLSKHLLPNIPWYLLDFYATFERKLPVYKISKSYRSYVYGYRYPTELYSRSISTLQGKIILAITK